MELRYLFSVHCLIMRYNCTKLCEYKEFQSYKADTICKLKFTKGHNFIKTLSEVMVLVLCISSDTVLYLCQVL